MGTVTFEAGRNGGVVSRYWGKVAFPEKYGPQPQAGEEWDVLEASPNPKETVYFLKLGKKIEYYTNVLRLEEGEYCTYFKNPCFRGLSNMDVVPGWENKLGCEHKDIVEVEVFLGKNQYGSPEEQARPVRIIKRIRDSFGGFSREELRDYIVSKREKFPFLVDEDLFWEQDGYYKFDSSLKGLSREEIEKVINERIESAVNKRKDIPAILMRNDPRYEVDSIFEVHNTKWCLKRDCYKNDAWIVVSREDVSIEEISYFFKSHSIEGDPIEWSGPIREDGIFENFWSD